jgi:hypothetical protein
MREHIDHDDEPEEDHIGTATLLADGTIHLFLIAEAEDGTHGEAMIVVSPKEARYQRIRNHLGDIKPGENKPVKPFPPAVPTPPTP